MFIVPCFIFVSFKCCTFGWLAKHEWEQAKAFFLCCLGIRWDAQNYYFGFRDDTGKTLMFSEVWNNRWFLMRLKKTPNQPCVICLQFRFLACRQQIKIRWNDCVSADFLIFHFLKVVPPGIVLYLQVAVYHHFQKRKRVISSYCSTLNLRCSAHRCMVVSCCKGSELLGTTIISVF